MNRGEHEGYLCLIILNLNLQIPASNLTRVTPHSPLQDNPVPPGTEPASVPGLWSSVLAEARQFVSQVAPPDLVQELGQVRGVVGAQCAPLHQGLEQLVSRGALFLLPLPDVRGAEDLKLLQVLRGKAFGDLQQQRGEGEGGRHV